MFERRLAFVAGVSSYDKCGPVPNAENDVRTIAAKLQSQGGFELFNDDFLLNPTAAILKRELRKFLDDIKPSDGCLAVVYFSGHGTAEALPVDHAHTLHYLLAADYDEDRRGGRDRALQLSCQLEADVLAKLGPAKAAVVIIDACRSGTIASSWGGYGRVEAEGGCRRATCCSRTRARRTEPRATARGGSAPSHSMSASMLVKDAGDCLGIRCCSCTAV
jgi:Caspase domain